MFGQDYGDDEENVTSTYRFEFFFFKNQSDCLVEFCYRIFLRTWRHAKSHSWAWTNWNQYKCNQVSRALPHRQLSAKRTLDRIYRPRLKKKNKNVTTVKSLIETLDVWKCRSKHVSHQKESGFFKKYTYNGIAKDKWKLMKKNIYVVSEYITHSDRENQYIERMFRVRVVQLVEGIVRKPVNTLTRKEEEYEHEENDEDEEKERENRDYIALNLLKKKKNSRFTCVKLLAINIGAIKSLALCQANNHPQRGSLAAIYMSQQASEARLL
ncbi:hypothetical protein RFI_05986 [Reticulomyxa filosa]|uniref:Uncharacterized protein n=1 Tax=Reticulomyxa filosa TaxID=46433 RepID=X6NZ17_RETFI|nr:hypothetical protein RFI_05986 [Reticulomyxa filosa]|eukprot:ETO31128.1 hypothetical protein RFI_05986 [Reticulomyxa filosa]